MQRRNAAVNSGRHRTQFDDARTHRTVFTHRRETTKPYIRGNGFVPKHGYGCTLPRDSVSRRPAI